MTRAPAPTDPRPPCRILGIDPGSLRCGWAVIDRAGNRITRVDSGVIATDPDAPMARRLVTLHTGLSAVIDRCDPRQAAVESIFHRHNAQSALKLGQARGVALLVAALRGLEVFEYEAPVVKQQITGHGQADKHQVRSMLALLFGWSPTTPLDESDALAVAVCHARRALLPAVAVGPSPAAARPASAPLRGARSGRVRPRPLSDP
jgi:crossover junction endodeoxyribonuclease RuvC